MQTNKKGMSREIFGFCSEDVKENITRFIRCFTSEDSSIRNSPDKLILCCIHRRLKVKGRIRDCKLVSACMDSLKKPLVVINAIAAKKVYWAGLQIAILCDDDIIPSLGMADVIQKTINIERNYIRLSDKGERVFLYGRDIFEESIIEKNIDRLECSNGVVVVLNKDGIPLGWGRLVEKQGKMLVKNLVDLGWYLRSGV